MTVSELIALLQDANSEAKVRFANVYEDNKYNAGHDPTTVIYRSNHVLITNELKQI